jgi:hypothetical protein
LPVSSVLASAPRIALESAREVSGAGARLTGVVCSPRAFGGHHRRTAGEATLAGSRGKDFSNGIPSPAVLLLLVGPPSVRGRGIRSREGHRLDAEPAPSSARATREAIDRARNGGPPTPCPGRRRKPPATAEAPDHRLGPDPVRCSRWPVAHAEARFGGRRPRRQNRAGDGIRTARDGNRACGPRLSHEGDAASPRATQIEGWAGVVGGGRSQVRTGLHSRFPALREICRENPHRWSSSFPPGLTTCLMTTTRTRRLPCRFLDGVDQATVFVSS